MLSSFAQDFFPDPHINTTTPFGTSFFGSGRTYIKKTAVSRLKHHLAGLTNSKNDIKLHSEGQHMSHNTFSVNFK
jgi:hypothetical protein